MDRHLPISLPYITERENGGARHPQRFDLSAQRHILIPTRINTMGALCEMKIEFVGKYVKKHILT